MAEGLNKYLGLLRWSLKYNDGTKTSAAPMEVERREWLMAAIEENMVDPVDQMKNLLKVLETPENESSDTKEYVAAKAEALEHLLDFVENIDLARDFIKIEGLPVVLKELKGEHAELRRGSAQVIAAIVQNHPETQTSVLKTDCLKLLVANLEREGATHLDRVKALLGVSSLIRGSAEGTKRFIKDHKGVPVMLRILANHDEDEQAIRLRRKVVFLLRYILFAVPQIRAALAITLVDSLTQLVQNSDIDIRESSLSLLEQILSDVSARKMIESFKPLEDKLKKYAEQMDLEKDDPAVVLSAKVLSLCQAASPKPEGLSEGSSLSDNVFSEFKKSEPMKLLKGAPQSS